MNPEHVYARLGHVTASRFKDVMTEGGKSVVAWKEDVLGNDVEASEQRIQRTFEDGNLLAKVTALKTEEIIQLFRIHIPPAAVKNTAGGGTKSVQAAKFERLWKDRQVELIEKPLTLDRLSDGAKSYLGMLVGEHLTDKPGEDFTSVATTWGLEHEDEARKRYEEDNCPVSLVKFVEHPTEKLIGASSDSDIGAYGIHEIKCPINAAVHAMTLMTGLMPAMHIPQVQGNLWVRERKFCDFQSYHPDFPHKAQSIVIRIERDEEYIAHLSQKVIQFRDLVMAELTKIRTEFGLPFI